MQDELTSQPSSFRLTRSSVLRALFCSLYRRTPHLCDAHAFLPQRSSAAILLQKSSTRVGGELHASVMQRFPARFTLKAFWENQLFQSRYHTLCSSLHQEQ